MHTCACQKLTFSASLHLFSTRVFEKWYHAEQEAHRLARLSGSVNARDPPVCTSLALRLQLYHAMLGMCLFVCLLLKINSCLIQYILTEVFPPSTPPSSPPTTLLPHIHSPSISCRKGAGLQEPTTKQNTDTVRQGKHSHVETIHGNLMGRKES